MRLPFEAHSHYPSSSELLISTTSAASQDECHSLYPVCLMGSVCVWVRISLLKSYVNNYVPNPISLEAPSTRASLFLMRQHVVLIPTWIDIFIQLLVGSINTVSVCFTYRLIKQRQFYRKRTNSRDVPCVGINEKIIPPQQMIPQTTNHPTARFLLPFK